KIAGSRIDLSGNVRPSVPVRGWKSGSAHSGKYSAQTCKCLNYGLYSAGRCLLRQINRICVFTTSDAREPRAVRHAIALAKRFPAAEVAFVDLHPAGEPMRVPGRMIGLRNVRRRSGSVPHRKHNLAALAFERALLAVAQMGGTGHFLKYSHSVQSN